MVNVESVNKDASNPVKETTQMAQEDHVATYFSEKKTNIFVFRKHSESCISFSLQFRSARLSSTAKLMTVEEIEDIAGGFSGDNVRTTSERTKVVMAKLKRQYREDKVDVESVDIQQSTELTDKKTEDDDYFLPGKASIFVKTWGCGHNNSDGEYMAGLLVAQGYTVILDEASKDSADLWLLNSCTVKGPSEQTFVNAILKAQDQGKSVVVAGCVPQASPRGGFWQKLSVIGV